jgi:signal transduction histidine kinase
MVERSRGAQKKHQIELIRAILNKHDLVLALTAIIGGLENIKNELKDTFNISKGWEKKLDDLIKTIEQQWHKFDNELAMELRGDTIASSDHFSVSDMSFALGDLINEIEKIKRELKESYSIGKRWEEMFDTLVELCKVQSDYFSHSKYEYDSIGKLIHECVDAYRSEAETRQIFFDVDLEQIEDEMGRHQVLKVCMDRKMLKQALLNVIHNAVKYSFSGTARHPRRVEVVGEICTLLHEPGYRILVSNLGIGIEADEIEKVFEPGYQGRRRFREYRPGHGIGLILVKIVIEGIHSGKVYISSQPQQRTAWLTTLKLWLPLHNPLQCPEET